MLVKLSLRNLVFERVKFIVGIISVGLAIMLVLVLLGVYNGAIKQAKSLPENSGADYWIVQKGTRDMFHTVSILAPDKTSDLQGIDGVESVSPAINAPTSISLGGKDTAVGIIAYDPATNLLGPPEITGGQAINSGNQLVVDESLAKQNGLQLGGSVEIFNRQFSIVGFSGGSNAIAFRYVFMSLNDYKQIQSTGESFVNYYLITSDSPIAEMQGEVEKILPGSTVRYTAEVADDNLAVINGSILPIIGFLVVIGVAVGIMIVSITVYNTTTERIRDYAILTAIGAHHSWLSKVAVLQAFIISTGGFGIGASGYFILQSLAPEALRSIEFNLSAPWLLAVALLTVLMSIIGALIPISKIKKIDPVEVFNA